MSYKALNLQDINDIDLKNTVLRCPFPSCHARIIPLTEPMVQNKVEVTHFPNMVNVSDNRTRSRFFKVNDAWDFDNIGVSRPSNELDEPVIHSGSADTEFKIERLLVCSECDRGPLGFAGYENGDNDIKQLKYFLSAESILC